MKCPNCGGELKFPQHAYSKMYDYLEPCTVATICCGVAVRLIPRMEYEAVATVGIYRDDWGNPCNTSSS